MLYSNLAVSHCIEKFGGSANYRNDLESSHPIPNYTHIATLSTAFTKTISASGDLWTAIIYTEIEVIAGEYSGVGHIWGVVIGQMTFGGVLSYNSWDELMSAENKIDILGGGIGVDALAVIFYINGTDVADLTISLGIGISFVFGLQGSFAWKYCGDEC